MIRLGSKVFVVIATLMLGLVVPPALAAEDAPQRRDAPSFDALVDGLQAKADRAMDAAIAAGERGNHTLKGLKDHWATKVDGLRAALSSQQSNWESLAPATGPSQNLFVLRSTSEQESENHA